MCNIEAPPRFEVKRPPGAPNVPTVLIDDIGFGGCIGGQGTTRISSGVRAQAEGCRGSGPRAAA